MKHFNLKLLGAAFLSTGLALMPLAPSKWCWWIGFSMTVLSPWLMAWKAKPDST